MVCYIIQVREEKNSAELLKGFIFKHRYIIY